MTGAIENYCDARVKATREKKLFNVVSTDAVQPRRRRRKNVTGVVVDSVAFRGLREDYLRVCRHEGGKGGVQIVYDGMGMGKSTALQAIARGAWWGEPNRFLYLGLQSSTSTCDELYEKILQLLGVDNIGMSVDDVVDVIHYGLVGPIDDQGKPIDETRTHDGCRMDITFSHSFAPSSIRKKFPMLVIDEFNPIDFADDKWGNDKDYTLEELRKDENMGKSIHFLNHLTGAAHQEEGFVVFVGTRHKSVAKALLKINGGTKASLAKSTLSNPRSVSLSDWRGFDWNDAEKKSFLGDRFRERFIAARRAHDDDDPYLIDQRWDDLVDTILPEGVSPNIRQLCDTMEEEVTEQRQEFYFGNRRRDCIRAHSCTEDFYEQCVIL